MSPFYQHEHDHNTKERIEELCCQPSLFIKTVSIFMCRCSEEWNTDRRRQRGSKGSRTLQACIEHWSQSTEFAAIAYRSDGDLDEDAAHHIRSEHPRQLGKTMGNWSCAFIKTRHQQKGTRMVLVEDGDYGPSFFAHFHCIRSQNMFGSTRNS